MEPLHVAAGFSVVVAFGLLALWGLVVWIARRSSPGKPFWWILTYVQVAVLVQLLIGLLLLALGGRRQLLHYVYGGIFPALVLITAHVIARERYAERAWAVFATAAFFCFGLTLRALQTGFAGS